MIKQRSQIKKVELCLFILPSTSPLSRLAGIPHVLGVDLDALAVGLGALDEVDQVLVQAGHF